MSNRALCGGAAFRMIPGPMSRMVKRALLPVLALALALTAGACGTERISVPKSNSALYQGAVLFNQRCAGCHTLSYAATHGSAANVRTAQYNNGPNFDIRCERPVTRVLYAIENGGFSGAYMPQNVVVGQDAIDVAKFVATYSGRQAPIQSGVIVCQKRSLGTLPPGSGSTQVASASSSASASATSTTNASTSQGLPPT